MMISIGIGKNFERYCPTMLPGVGTECPLSWFVAAERRGMGSFDSIRLANAFDRPPT